MGCLFSSFHEKDKKVVKLNPYDPKKEHLVVYPGLNLKGKC